MAHRSSDDQEQAAAKSCWYCSVFNLVRKADPAAARTQQQQQQQQQQQEVQQVTQIPLPQDEPAIINTGSGYSAFAAPAAQTTHPLQQTQQQQQSAAPVHAVEQGDCLGCRVTGLMLGLGGAGYVSSRLFEQPRPVGAHRYTLIGVSVGLAGLGIARAVGL